MRPFLRMEWAFSTFFNQNYPYRALYKLVIPQAQILKISFDAMDDYSFGEDVGLLKMLDTNARAESILILNFEVSGYNRREIP